MSFLNQAPQPDDDALDVSGDVSAATKPGFFDRHPTLSTILSIADPNGVGRVIANQQNRQALAEYRKSQVTNRAEALALRLKQEQRTAEDAADKHAKAVGEQVDAATRQLGAGGTSNQKDFITLLKGKPNVNYNPGTPDIQGPEAMQGLSGPVGENVNPDGTPAPQNMAVSFNPKPLPREVVTGQPESVTYLGTPEQRAAETLAKQIESSDDPMAKTVAAAVRAGDKSAVNLLKPRQTSFQFEKDYEVPGHPGAIVSFDPASNKLTAQTPAGQPIPNATFKRVAAPVDPSIVAERERRAAEAGEKKTNVKSMADAIEAGRQAPPPLSARGQNTELFAELEHRGFDVRQAQLDYQGALASVKSLNGPQQVRLGQNIRNTSHSLDKIDELADKWDSKGWGALSRANLEAAREGAYGTRAQSIGNQLTAQIKDVTSELAGVYSGGNASTQEHLKLAGDNLQAWWGAGVMHDMTKLARYNLNTRKTAMSETEPIAGGKKDEHPAEPVSKVQRNTKTGETRTVYSYDGGQTWGSKR